MTLSIFLSDDVALATALAFGPTDAGATSAAQTLHAWNNKGTSGGSLRDLAFVVQVEDPASPGTFKSSGLTALDEHWLEVRVNGGANPGNDPGFLSQTSAWYRLGSGVVLRAPDLPGNCALYLEARLHPPLREGVPTESVNFRLLATYAETATPAGLGLSELGSGFLTGVGDRTVREWVEAPAVTPTGTPDAYIHVARRWYVHDGISLRSCATEDLLLNQTDGASASLSTGQEYKALISQGPGDGTGDQAVTVTKGVKAATGASVAPALPATHLPVALVTVAYHAGASVISSGAISVLATDGRAKASAGSGLTVNVAKFRALVAGGLIVTGQATTVAVGASTTSWVWIGGSGAFTVTTTATPPFVGALPVCKVVTGSSTVSSVTDLRSFFEPGALLVRLKSLTAASGTTTFDAAAMPAAWNVDRVLARLGAAVSGSGSTEFNPKTSAGSSLCPATFRPTIAAGAVAAEGYPNRTVGAADTFLGALAADTTPAATMIEVDLVVYPLARAS